MNHVLNVDSRSGVHGIGRYRAQPLRASRLPVRPAAGQANQRRPNNSSGRRRRHGLSEVRRGCIGGAVPGASPPLPDPHPTRLRLADPEMCGERSGTRRVRVVWPSR